ncbi:MAG: MATE family efflux transporter [Saprospiraceae bacterium]
MRKYFNLFIEAVKGKEQSFTEGSVKRALFMLSIPVILEMGMESLFAIVDAFFIGQIGSANALATIGITDSFLFIVFSLAMGISMAATAIVARRIGEKEPDKASEAAFQAILLTIFFSIIIAIIGYWYTDDLFRLMGASEDLIEEGGTYTQIILTLNIIIMMLFAINAIYRGAGDASIAMRTLILANGINIILDPCLIMGYLFFPKMGLTGAAIATCIGRGVGVLYQVYYLTNGKSVIHINASHVRVVWKTIKKLIKISLGGAGQHLIASASFIFLVWILNAFGSETVAGYTLAWKVLYFTILPSWGIAMAGAALVGQNLGAKQPERAEESVWMAARYNMYILLILSVIFIILARPVIGIFSNDEVVINQGATALQIIFAGYVFYAYEMVIGQAFNGAGDTVTPTVLNFIAFWLVQIPLAYYLANYTSLGPTGVYISITISSSLLAVMAIYIFRKGRWKTIKV